MSNLLDKASVILTPTAYNTSEALCVKPSDGTGDFDFSRATDATRINSLGLVETIGINLPRINYEGGCGSWLFEPQTTQLLPYSEDFSQWNAGGDTTIESGYLAPDGTNNAYKVSGTSSAMTFGASLLTTTTRTIYARTVSGTGQANLCSFNSNTNNLFTITEQWQRFEVNATAVASNSFYAIDFRGSTTLTEIILWGANATNDQDYSTSYITSNGSTVTRNQDLCTGGGSVSSINSTEGVLYFETKTLVDGGANRYLSLSDGTNSNLLQVLYFSNGNLRIASSGTPAGFQSITITNITQNNNNKIAVKYSISEFKIFINGTQEGSLSTNTSWSNNTLNNINFSLGNNSFPFFGNTNCVAVWKEALSDSELQSLTTI